MQMIASAQAIGHVAAVTSSAIGGHRFGSSASARHAAMLASAFSDTSLGCQVKPGNAPARWIACSPLPLAISRTVPVGGSSRASTSRIGSRLRAVAGA
jgi:hypothetical protein